MMSVEAVMPTTSTSSEVLRRQVESRGQSRAEIDALLREEQSRDRCSAEGRAERRTNRGRR